VYEVHPPHPCRTHSAHHSPPLSSPSCQNSPFHMNPSHIQVSAAHKNSEVWRELFMALRWSRRPKCVYREAVIDAGGRPAGIWLSQSAAALSCGCHGSGWRLQDEQLSVRVDLLTETDRQIPVFIFGLFNDALWNTYVTTTEGEKDLPEATQRTSTLDFFGAPFQPESAQTDSDRRGCWAQARTRDPPELTNAAPTFLKNNQLHYTIC